MLAEEEIIESITTHGVLEAMMINSQNMSAEQTEAMFEAFYYAITELGVATDLIEKAERNMIESLKEKWAIV